MILILGLLLLVAAVIVAVAGVLGNTGATHALIHGFSVLGYHVTGSTGTPFLYGIVVGAVGVFGLSLLLTSARRSARRGRATSGGLKQTSGGLKQSYGATAVVSRGRDGPVDQREPARAEAIGATSNGSPRAQRGLHRGGHRAEEASAASTTAADG